MPPTSDIATVTDTVLARAYDPGSLERGRAYAAEGRARVVSLRDGTLTGVVAGSGRNTYLVRIEWAGGEGATAIIDDECTCPLGGACKHAVASLLTARGADSLRRPDWRRALAAIVDDGDRAGTGDQVPMALEVVDERPRTGGAAGPARPVVRPLRLGRHGRWVRTRASWRDVAQASYSLRDVEAAHASALGALVAGARMASYYPDASPLPLDSFGPDLWHHLARAVDVGVTLVGHGGREDTVELHDPVAVSVDLTTADDGTVRVAAVLTPEGGDPLAIDAATAVVLGSPAHGLHHGADGVLHLVPFAGAVHHGLADLLTGPPLTVPTDDVEELLDAYRPRLARVAPVRSSDGSVDVAAAELDGITLTVERPTVDQARLTWSARYLRGDRPSLHPLVGVADLGRDQTGEAALLVDLELPVHLLPGLVDRAGRPRDLALSGTDVVTLLTEAVPWLEERGQVAVEVTGDAPELREATEQPMVSLHVADAEDTGRRGTAAARRTDWFDLEVEVTVEGEQVPFVPLFRALADDEPVLVLDTGTWLRLDRPELAGLKALIDEARGLADPDDEGTVRVNRFQVDWWKELTALGVVSRQSDRWAAAMGQMASISAPATVEPSPGLRATLRPYQREGLDWLAFLHTHGLGGILADDMGLGKTVQTLALCLHVLDRDPDARFLVVAPTSVVENWHREASQFAPGVEVRTIKGTAARRGVPLTEAVGDARIVVTSYALFRLEFEAYDAMGWDLLLLDEAQFVKNHTSKTYQCARRLDAATKIAITGTPLENSLMDLWSLLSLTAPGLYPDPGRFADVYAKPIERGDAPELLATLRRRIAPLMRRRTKDEVLTDLPPKTEQTVEVELSERHARIYQTQLQRQRQKVLGLVDDVQQHRFEILKSLTILRQLSLDPGLVDPAHDAVGSAKLDRLEADLVQVVAEGHRALVFSQFTRYLARVRDRLDRAGIAHAYLDGRTRRRDEEITRFRSGEVPVFVISLKAGGFGLNLTEADYCFVLDPWWNPAVETQAVDRAHRIGQTNPVMVYRYVATDTIEEKVMELKERKAALFADVMGSDSALSGALSAADIRGLLDLP